MELKYVILFPITLSVGFIMGVMILSQSLWNTPKLRLVASRQSVDNKINGAHMKNNIPRDNDRLHGLYHDTVGNDVLPNLNQNFESWRRNKEEILSSSSDLPIQKLNPEDELRIKKLNTDGFKRQKKKRIRPELLIDEYVDEETKLRTSPYIYRRDEEIEKLKIPIFEKDVKYISYFMPWEAKEMERLSFHHCRYKKCVFEKDMARADLVAFSASSLRDHDIPSYQRLENQRWVMYTVDPAIRGFKLGVERLQSHFNATNTYNLDADIPHIFGRLAKLSKKIDIDYDALFDKKTKLAAWFVSHCATYSRREKYVSRMQSEMDIDIYGECGPYNCSSGHTNRGIDTTVCLPLLTTTYKFYLAFENANCLEYITEKFFKLFTKNVHTIPVVRGGFQYKKFLPADIFVNADDFESPEALSRYLVELGNDKRRYTEMLRRKSQWRLVPPVQRQCLLCEYLHSNPPPKTYPNLQDKFGSHMCWYPKGL